MKRRDWEIPKDATLEEELAIRDRTIRQFRVERIMRNAPTREPRREAPPERRVERSERPREHRSTRSHRRRGPPKSDDSDPHPPPAEPPPAADVEAPSGQTRFQRALVAALELDRDELATLADHVRIRLVWIDRHEGGSA
jgi:hypothetical protein